jgi:signal transduction histidine kinase
VSLESEPGRGSLFTVAIPFGAEHLPRERIGSRRRRASTAIRADAYVDEAMRWLADDLDADDTSAAPPIVTSGARVLVADDNADMREYLRSLLGAHWTVECVGDGAAALEAARARPPALVLTDVMMPGLDGFELLRELRTDERTRTTPVILVSARAGDESRVEGLDAGADDYLVKPFSARELLARVNAHLQLAEMRRQALAREQDARRVADQLSQEMRRLLERERASRAEAEAANRAKDEFLAILSHELRTPLNAVLGWARILKTTPENGALLQRAVDTIARNAELQAQLIDDLLDVSRIVAGKLSLEIAAVDLVRLVEDAVQSVSAAAAAKGVRVEIESGGVSEFVAGDSGRLQQVVWNLLSNAVKFTPTDGLVRIAVRPDADWIDIAVSDSGAGIDPAFLPHVFERFRQADSTTTRGHGGLGLGLAIVRHIVEHHGGTVHAKSDGLGRGATFTVRLPRREPPETPTSDDESQTPRAAIPPGPLLSGLRILVVDDEPDSRDVVAMALGEYGAIVTVVGSVGEAMSVLGASSPQVLVSDISMPGEDGYELIRRVRAQPEAGRARVMAIALTAHARPEERLQSLMAGFDAHVAKPIDPAELATVIARLTGVTP